MTPIEAQQSVDQLAQGIDPDTGVVMHDESLFNSPTVLRALFLASKALSVYQPTKHLTPPKVGNAGKPWTDADGQRLVAAFDTGISIDELAIRHERSKGGIASRLVRLGRIEERSEVYQRDKPLPVTP